jgi:SAM-dependent methyltransferase
MIRTRHVEPEILDRLPADDPRAIRSRRDLRLCNALMRQPAIMARLIQRHCEDPPRRVVDIGSGDGTFMLALARRLALRWQNVSLTLIDRQPVVGRPTIDAFARLGWRVESLCADAFEFFGSGRQFDLVTANLFLHHFPAGGLANLLARIARSTSVFAAGEPRRGVAAALGTRLLWALGCNDVTLHDAPASVRAGFRGLELSGLWPKSSGWVLHERGAPPFTHSFAATRIRSGGRA